MPQNNQTQQNLHIDNIVASQPELGPTPPDGGYGWIILICAVIVQMTISSVTIAFGIIILYSNLQVEYEENQVFKLWQNSVILVPILIAVFSSLTSSWSRQIVNLSNRPRLVSMSGIFMITAGILLASVGVEAKEDGVIFNIFAGLSAGIGTSLTVQQTEILLKHYFNRRYILVQSIYKMSINFGSVLMSIIMGTLLSNFELKHSLSVLSLVILQNAIILLTYTRPTYITVAVQKSYKALKEGSDDEDEIYSSENPPVSSANTSNVHVVHVNEIADDDNDEEVIGTFNNKNATKEVIQPSPAALSRMDSLNNERRDGTIIEPDSLYRETTITNTDAPNGMFAFEPPTTGTIRRTADVRKHAMVLIATLKDIRFYIHTYVGFNIKLSMLIMGVLFPAYVSQQIPEMEMWTVTGLIIVTYLAATCMNIVIAFIPYENYRLFYLALFSLLSFLGLMGIAYSSVKTWLVIFGIWSIFSTTALYLVEQPMWKNMRMEQELSAVYTASNCLIAVGIVLTMTIYSYKYQTCFKIAAIMQAMSPILLAFIRKYG